MSDGVTEGEIKNLAEWLSALSDSNIDVSEAESRIRAKIGHMVRPTEGAKKELARLGIPVDPMMPGTDSGIGK